MQFNRPRMRNYFKLSLKTRLYYFFVLAAIFLTSLPLEADTLNKSKFPLVEVHYENAAQKQQLLSLIAPWKTTPEHLLINPSPSILQQIQDWGFSTQILYQNRSEFIQSMSSHHYRSTTENAGAYHTYAELKAELEQLQLDYPALVQWIDIGDSWEKTQGLADHDILALKISTNAASTEKDHKILLLGGHHAREWISVEVPLLIGRYLLENYATNSEIQSYLSQGEIWIVPMVNPDGHQYSVEHDRWWRKNRRKNSDGSFGVDLNRNYAYQWSGPGSSDLTTSDSYHGEYAFSEPESQAIRDLAMAHHFNAMVSYHSYGEQVFFPWNYGEERPLEQELLETLATDMGDKIHSISGKNYEVLQGAYDYPASGTTDDWFYAQFRSISFTIELPPSGHPYFELPEEEIQPSFEENLPAALALIEWSQLDNPQPLIRPSSLNPESNSSLTPSTPIGLDISLQAGNRQNITADWWLYAETPSGYYYFNAATSSWHPGISVSYQGKAFDLSELSIINQSQFPSGKYVLYFGLETHADGVMDEEIMFVHPYSFSINPE